MNEPPQESTAVFVDKSGRRGKILTATVIGSGIVVLALLATVIGGVIGGTTLPGVSWPGQPQKQPPLRGTSSTAPDDHSPGSPAPDPTPSVVDGTAPGTPSVTASPTPRQRTLSPSPPPPPTGQPGNAPTEIPGSDGLNPGHGGTPPGQVVKSREPE